MMIKVILIILLIVPSTSYASQTPTLKEFLVAGTVKNLAKIFIHTCNLKKLKTKHINSLSKLDEEKFRSRYHKVYQIIKDVPSQLRLKYDLKEELTKKEALKLVHKITKKDLLYIVKAIPNDFIVKNIKSRSANMPEENLNSQAHTLWQSLMKKV